MKFEAADTWMRRLAILAAFSLVFRVAWSKQRKDPPGAKDTDAAIRKDDLRASAAASKTVAPGSRAGSPKVGRDFVIGPSDVLAVSVWKEPEISRTLPVRVDGKISLPLLGDLVASGLTPQQLEAVIAGRLHSYIANPEVTVIVQEAKSKHVNIVGKVAKPGAYDLVKPMTVLDVIALAGGFSDYAKTKKIYVLRIDSNGAASRIAFNYKDVLKGRHLFENVQLEPGDTIVVP